MMTFQNYIVYYTKNPDAPLVDWEKKILPGDADHTTISVEDEDTPYVIRVQAATEDGPGIISEAYEVTTGKKRKNDNNGSSVNFRCYRDTFGCHLGSD